MKRLADYIAESEIWVNGPAVGDSFAINIREECLLETYIVDTTDDGYVLHADQHMLHLLEGYGYLTENDEAQDAMRNAVIRRITMQHADLLQRYGVEAVLTAVEDIVDDIGDMEEIGSSDVSAYVKMVKDQLEDRLSSREEMIDRKPFAQTRSDSQTVRSAKPDDSLLRRMMELAGVPAAPTMEDSDEDDIVADLDAEAEDDENLNEAVMKDIAIELGEIADAQDYDRLYDLMTATSPAGQMVQKIADDVIIDHQLRDDDHEELLELVMDRIIDDFGGQLDEAEYRGRKVALGKPMKGDVKKSKVYVRGPKGNVVKVNFGDPNMKIKKSNPKRRKSFRARHNCDNPGPRWKARYWSCRAW